ncbi:MAG: amidohydrolase [Candidatus Bathyarchaeota archaeon]|nr:amidohydrolase [Candidatus Bathyarchaeota archaeon]
MSKGKPCVEAVAVKGGRVIKVGSTDEISLLIGKDTEILYLDWRTVMPGFIDTHIHLADFGRFLMWIDLAAVGSISRMQVLLSQRVEKTSADKWIVGRGWSENRFIEKRLPTRSDLDKVAPDHPVLFYHQAGPVALVNSKALQLAGITKDTEAPLGGVIDKDEAGEPTGVIRGSAMDIVWKLVPETGIDELVDSAAMACEKIMQSGITSIHWLAESSADVAIFKKLVETGKLPLRVYMVIPASLLGDAALIEGLQKGESRIGAVEVAADGYLASKTAALVKPYCGDDNNKGKMLLRQNELNTASENIVKRGFQLVLHAMGDKAVGKALTAIETVASVEKSRSRIDPAALLNKALIERLKKQRVVVSVQPLVAASEFSVYDALEHLGEDRARWLYPLKTLFNEGIRVCGGSDCPMEPLNPLLSIQSAATRRFFPEEQLTVHEALCMYTVNAAYASAEEKDKGSIEEGKYADFTVLSKNPEETPISKLHEITVEMTIIGGKITYTS